MSLLEQLPIRFKLAFDVLPAARWHWLELFPVAMPHTTFLHIERWERRHLEASAGSAFSTGPEFALKTSDITLADPAGASSIGVALTKTQARLLRAIARGDIRGAHATEDLWSIFWDRVIAEPHTPAWDWFKKQEPQTAEYYSKVRKQIDLEGVERVVALTAIWPKEGT